MNTQDVIANMLRENTGRSILDSGDAYGRHWQQNRNVDLEAAPATSLAFRVVKYKADPSLEIEVVHNVYHWLRERLSYDTDFGRAMAACVRFVRIANHRAGRIGYGDDRGNGTLPCGLEMAELFPVFFGAWKARQDKADRDECDECFGEGTVDSDGSNAFETEVTCLGCSGRGWKRLAELSYSDSKGFSFDLDNDDYSPKGIYGEGEPMTVNTYNEENLLSQTLQFVYFTMGGTEYVALQIHGGCDVRGGYTDPVLFEVDGNMGELAILDFKRASIYCTEGGRHDLDVQTELFPKSHHRADIQDNHSWYTDDGYHFYPSNDERNLDKYPLAVIDAEHFAALAVMSEDNTEHALTLEGGDGITYVRAWVKGYLCVNNDTREALCPHCGGKLAASSF